MPTKPDAPGNGSSRIRARAKTRPRSTAAAKRHARPRHARAAREFFVQLGVNCILGLMVWLVLDLLHGWAPLRALERIGGDAAMRVYAANYHSPNRPDVVLLSIDDDTVTDWGGPSNLRLAKKLTDLLEVVRGARPKAVIVDLRIESTLSGENVDGLLNELKNAHESPVILPIPLRVSTVFGNWIAGVDPLDKLEGVAYVKRSVALIVPDEDGIVRYTGGAVCVWSESGGSKYQLWSKPLTNFSPLRLPAQATPLRQMSSQSCIGYRRHICSMDATVTLYPRERLRSE